VTRPIRSTPPVYILGGAQTDFARNWTREGHDLSALITETAQGALAHAKVDAREVEVGHVASFIPELTTRQSHLGGLLVEADRGFTGMPTSRHEAACAAGGAAVLAAMADLNAGRYDLALVLGVELMRAMSATQSQKLLEVAGWVARETGELAWPWPELFDRIAGEYDRRYGIDHKHLGMIARKNFSNAKRNPLAQTRRWDFNERSFDTDDQGNPVVSGRVRRQDCSQVTDGGAAVVLASERFVREHCRREGRALETYARIQGWGHRTARMTLADKLAESRGDEYVFPHVRGAIFDAFLRAGVRGAQDVDVFETHDCFTVTEYMAIEHFGLAPPGRAWQVIEDGAVMLGGSKPVNASGGLIGAGHPVGATGVRMVLDLARQVTGTADGYQVAGARRGASLNIGGSATTAVCFVVEGSPA
jgi:acetyl-CoA C-acetyltransferase